LAKRLNVRTMSASNASTLEKRDIVRGAAILAATLGDAPEPPKPPRVDPVREALHALGPLGDVAGRLDRLEAALLRPAPPPANPLGGNNQT
jgi:hypothetical protein